MKKQSASMCMSIKKAKSLSSENGGSQSKLNTAQREELLRQHLCKILSHTGQVITVEIISAAVFDLIVEPVFIGGVASAYKILEHQQK